MRCMTVFFQTQIQLANLGVDSLSSSDIMETWYPEFAELWHKLEAKYLKRFLLQKNV